MTHTPFLVMGDDGSDQADRAWRWVDAQDWDGWRVDVITADDDPAKIPTTPELAAARPWLPPTPRTPADPTRLGGGVQHLVAIGDPRLVLLGFPDAELLVIGARGAGRMPVTLGSTADSLLHGPPCPLVIARDDRPVRRVLVGADGSADAEAAAARFARLPWAARTRVQVLSVADGRTDPVASSSAMVALLSEAGLVTEVVPTSRGREDPRSALVEAARSVDLVVMGTRGVGVGLVRRFLGGSVATHLAHHAPCSVLIAEADRRRA